MTDIDRIIARCTKPDMHQTFEAIKDLDRAERDVLIRTFEFSHKRFSKNLKFALDYLIK